MSEYNLRLKKTLNVNPSDHYKFMEGLQGVIEHYMGFFNLAVPPFVLAPPPIKEERVNVNMSVNMSTVDDALLSRIGFFTVYWKKFGYYPLAKFDLAGVPVTRPAPILDERETQLWKDITKEHGFIHSFLANYMFREMQPGVSGTAVHHIIPRVTASGEDTKRYPTVIYLANDETSVYDVQPDKCLEKVTMFYEDNSYYHGCILVHDIFGPLRHGEGFYRDMSAKTEVHGFFAWNELSKTLKKTEL
jgi:hypothetical protein